MTQDWGATAWGRDWVRLAEPTRITRPNPKLPQARSLARRELVSGLELAVGRVEADVNGYRARVTVPVWDSATLARARELVAGQPEDLPDELRPSFPESAPGVVGTECSCTTRVQPCVHVLALFYETARRIDERPRLEFVLKGLISTPPARDAARVPLGLLDAAGFYG